MEGVIETEREEVDAELPLFPGLERLVLKDLPLLEMFASGSDISKWPALRIVEIMACPKRKISDTKSIKALETSNLKNFARSFFHQKLQGTRAEDEPEATNSESQSSNALHQERQLLKGSLCKSREVKSEVIQLDVPKLPCSEDGVCVFRNLTKLIIYNGDNVRYLLSPSITSEILSIQELGIEQGQLIEELIRDVEDEEKTDNLVLPQLMKLVLGKLENLRWFFHGDLGFSSLVDFTFYDSPRMKVVCCGTLCTAKTFEVKIWFRDGTSMIQLDPDIEGSQIAMKNEAEFSTTLVEDVEFVEMDNTPCTWSPTGLPLMIHFLMEAPSPGISSHPLSRIE
ncbi:hypothetical protein M9H77_09359 [Catharanthus roseus]|uniref:Uncharacterized protein n=1 Tax=Catharanthus roseus TaxID=4058 RepID=A0ACC0C0D0_CATRO|nr:hypothetical protein M9H77_09359 [Catharanthus roseus]